MTEEWREAAACRAEDPDLFFPVAGAVPAAQAEQAKAVCRRCPSLDDCRAWSLATRQPAGVWGGLDEGERDEVLGRRVRDRTWRRTDAEQAKHAREFYRPAGRKVSS